MIFPPPGTSRPRVIAHRGARRDAPENTLAAFRLALDQGADLLELDVRQTRDGELVVIHDEYVNRTTNGVGAVRDLQYAELHRLDAGLWRGEQFTGQRVPRLREVLDLTAGAAGIAVELKGYHLEQAALAVELIQQVGREHDTILVSRHCRIIDQIRRLSPSVGVSCYEHNALRWQDHFWEHGPPLVWHSDYLFVKAAAVDSNMVGEIQESGRWVVTELESRGRVNTEEVRRLADLGVDGIVTDDVLGVFEVLR